MPLMRGDKNAQILKTLVEQRKRFLDFLVSAPAEFDAWPEWKRSLLWSPSDSKSQDQSAAHELTQVPGAVAEPDATSAEDA
jgi:hypothetical protein